MCRLFRKRPTFFECSISFFLLTIYAYYANYDLNAIYSGNHRSENEMCREQALRDKKHFSKCRVHYPLISLDKFDFLSSISRHWRHMYDDFTALSGNVISIQKEKTLVMSMKLCAGVGSENGLIASFERICDLNDSKNIHFSYMLDNNELIVRTKKQLYDCIKSSFRYRTKVNNGTLRSTFIVVKNKSDTRLYKTIPRQSEFEDDNKEVFKETIYKLLLRKKDTDQLLTSEFSSSWKNSYLSTPYIVIGDPETTGIKFLFDKKSSGILESDPTVEKSWLNHSKILENDAWRKAYDHAIDKKPYSFSFYYLALMILAGYNLFYQALFKLCKSLYELQHPRAVEFLMTGSESATYLIASQEQHFNIKYKHLGIISYDPTFLSCVILQMVPLLPIISIAGLFFFACRKSLDLFEVQQGEIILYGSKKRHSLKTDL